MDKNSIELEKIKLKVNSLVALRQLITQTLALMIGGLAGICFMPNGTLKFIIIGLGLFYVIVLARNLYFVICELNANLYKKLEEIE